MAMSLRRLAVVPTVAESSLPSYAVQRWLRLVGRVGQFVGWLARPWRHQAAFTERHPWESAGFAVGTVTFLAIPVLGVFFRAVAITAATAMVVKGEPTWDPANRELARPGDPV